MENALQIELIPKVFGIIERRHYYAEGQFLLIRTELINRLQSCLLLLRQFFIPLNLLSRCKRSYHIISLHQPKVPSLFHVEVFLLAYFLKCFHPFLLYHLFYLILQKLFIHFIFLEQLLQPIYSLLHRQLFQNLCPFFLLQFYRLVILLQQPYLFIEGSQLKHYGLGQILVLFVSLIIIVELLCLVVYVQKGYVEVADHLSS